VKQIGTIAHLGPAISSIATVPIMKEESDKHIFDKLRLKINSNLKRYNSSSRWTRNMVVNFNGITCISRKDAKRIIMDALFYDMNKYNASYSEHFSPDYKILYAALFGNNWSLQSQCFEQIQDIVLQKHKLLKDKGQAEMSKLNEASNNQQLLEKGDQKEVGAKSLEACEKEMCYFNGVKDEIPKTVYDELCAVQYFHGRDVGSKTDCLESDESDCWYQ